MCKKLIYLVSFVLVLGFVVTNTANADPGLVGWWTFDEGSGTTASDSSGNGNHGTLIDSVQWAAGQIGGALKFDGSPGYVLIPHSDELKLVNQGDFTCTMWFKMDVVTFGNLLQQTDVNGTGRTWLFVHSSEEIRAYLGGAATGSGVNAEAGIWYHIAVVVTEAGATDTVDLYLNGEPVGTQGQLGMEDCEGDYLIGTDKGIAGRWLNGLVDDVRLYNHALSELEILGAMHGSGDVWPYALAPDPADGAMLEATWANISWRPGGHAVSHDVYIGDNFDDVNDGAEGTFLGNQAGTTLIVGFPGFAFPDGLVPGTAYYWRIDEVNDLDPNSPWKGKVWSFSIAPNTAYNPNPTDGAESVDPNVELSWTGGFGAKLHTVYFGDNFDDVNNAAGGLPRGVATYTPPGPLKLAKTYYWRVDEFDAITTYKGDVWSFITQGAVGNPNPANGAVDVEQTPVLTWTPGVYAASHQVYFGTDKEAVKNANTSSPEYKGSGNLGSESYDPGKLEWYSTYYWRIDEVNNVNPDSPWTGNVWNFTTADFIVIEDFEDYNDYPPDEIFSTWIDGYGTTTNGSTAGYAEPDFLAGEHYIETSIVHGGDQSMPLFYDNNFKYSEATMTLVSGRDWTRRGVGLLSLWFRGDAANAAERMYVALNGSAVVYHDNPGAALINTWTEWTIGLQEFAAQGVNLANVNTIAIGFGDKNNLKVGGSGMVFFDDIRLYRPAPIEPEPVP